ncbi:hypothetical protein ACVWYQ_000286 [Bradyrhizobium sp. USDA 3397]
MDKVEDDGWRLFLRYFGLLSLVAALLKVGSLYIDTRENLKESECRVAYWEDRARGQPEPTYPSGCPSYLYFYVSGR